MHITILGGAGIIGREIARLLAAEPSVTRLVVADLDEAGAAAVAASLPPHVTSCQVDASDPDSLARALAGASVALNGVQYYFNLPIMEAALAAGAHYVDLGGLFHTTRRQLELDGRFREAGLTAVLGMGSCPGVSNVQAAHAASLLDSVEALTIFNGATQDKGDALDWSYSIQTILDEIAQPAIHFHGGEFHEVPALSGEEWYAFDEPIGWAKVHHSLHSEVATLPLVLAAKGLQECAFKISFFGYSEAALRQLQFLVELGLARTDPVEVRGQSVRPRDLLVRLLQEAPQRARPSEVAAKGFKHIATVARGRKGDQPATVTVNTTAWPHPHLDLSGGTLLVAAPPALVATWLGAGRLTTRGVLPPESLIPPRDFFRALAAYGPQSTVEWEEPLA